MPHQYTDLRWDIHELTVYKDIKMSMYVKEKLLIGITLDSIYC